MTRKNTTPLSLRVPEPLSRPGDKPDFSGLELDAPGAVARPDVGAAPADMRDHAFRLIRVLDDEGKAVGPWDPKLDAETLKKGLKAMILTRAFDDGELDKEFKAMQGVSDEMRAEMAQKERLEDDELLRTARDVAG